MEQAMSHRTRFKAVLILALAVPLLAVQTTARAAVISSEQFMSATDRRAAIDAVTAALARDEVQIALRHHGVDPVVAVERVAALNDQELMLLAEDLENLPAGGSLLGTLGIVAIVIVILELVGVIDIFKKL
jgi:hypothetical protein